MRVTAIENSFFIRVFPNDGPNYSTIAFVEVNGCEGIVKGMLGEHFYQEAKQIWKLCEGRGLTSLEGWMTKTHHRLLERATRTFGKVSILRSGVQYGFPMVYVLWERNQIL